MKNATTLTAADWIALSPEKAAVLFTGSRSEVHTLYRRLVKQWHPDRNRDPQAHAVFVLIQLAYKKALALAGDPPTPHPLTFSITDTDGRVFQFRGGFGEPFILGLEAWGQRHLAYRVEAAHKDLFESFLRRVRSLPFANGDMEKQMAPLLPHLAGAPWGDGGGMVVISKDPKMLRLQDVHNHYRAQGQTVPPEHVAWVVSGLLNLACYLSFSKIAHQAIDLRNVWIQPETHSVHLLGGWFFSQPFGETLSVLPTSSATSVSRRYLEGKVAGPEADLSLVLALARELLGDRSGQRLLGNPLVPQPMSRMLLSPPGKEAIPLYSQWKETLKASFGRPRFVPMSLTSSTLYQE